MKPEDLAALHALAAELAPLLAVELGRVSYSVDECAARLGCGRDLIYSETRTGRLPSFTVGSRRFISRNALEGWVAAREHEASGAA